MKHTIADWLKSLELRAGDRIVDGDKCWHCEEIDGYLRFGPYAMPYLEKYGDHYGIDHPEHWRRTTVSRLYQNALTEGWCCLSRYDDWAKKLSEEKAPEPWAELKEFRRYHLAHKHETIHLCAETAHDAVLAAWPEIERRVRQMIVNELVLAAGRK